MIISRTPFRISFAGGGSDLKSFYCNSMGAVLSTTINKYMYLAIHPYFDSQKIQLKYSKTELVSKIAEISHPIFRVVLDMYKLSGVDINSVADIPSGTGLGSSSSFTVGLLNAVNAYKSTYISPSHLAEKACQVEIDIIKSPIGKQDQYVASYGGLNFITFHTDGSVKIDKIIMDPEKKKQLENNLIMVYTGNVRSANELLEKQIDALSDRKKYESQKMMVELAHELKNSLEKNNIEQFGYILHDGWELKKSLTSSISNNYVDRIYEEGIRAGAIGGKLLGAGGGGFILFYCPKDKQSGFRSFMKKYKEIKFSFDNTGSQIIHIGDR